MHAGACDGDGWYSYLNYVCLFSADELRELSLDVLTTHVRKTSCALQQQQIQQLLPLLLQWLQSFAPDNDFIVPATQSVCELVAAVMQFAAQDVVQSCAPGIMLLVGGLLQPQLQERAVLYAPKLFTQVRDESYHCEIL